MVTQLITDGAICATLPEAKIAITSATPKIVMGWVFSRDRVGDFGRQSTQKGNATILAPLTRQRKRIGHTLQLRSDIIAGM
jgi:hypothetical protein